MFWSRIASHHADTVSKPPTPPPSLRTSKDGSFITKQDLAAPHAPTRINSPAAGGAPVFMSQESHSRWEGDVTACACKCYYNGLILDKSNPPTHWHMDHMCTLKHWGAIEQDADRAEKKRKWEEMINERVNRMVQEYRPSDPM
jgi:hypothetical protein